jgi:hypothetical protein
MATVKFTHEEIEDLARKVGALGPFFSKKERALLLAIFAAAAEKVTSSAKIGEFPGSEPSADSATLENLQEQLLKAYIPGNAPPHGISAKIIGDVQGP